MPKHWQINLRGPKPPVSVSLDLEGRIVYIRVRKGKIYQTLEHKPGVYLDVDREGRLLAIELLHPASAEGIKDVSDEYLEGDREKVLVRAVRVMEAALEPV